MKFTPRQTLWTMFLLQMVFSLGMLLIAVYVHAKETQLMAKQPTVQASDERARAHIQAEQDIEQLRAAALHVQNASDITWDGFVKMMRWLDIGIWSISLSSVGIAIIGGYAIYAFRDKKAQPNQALQPTATAPSVLREP